MCCSDQVLFMFSPALCTSWHKPKVVYYRESYWSGSGFSSVCNPSVLTLLHTKILHFPTGFFFFFNFYCTWPDLLLFTIQRKIPELQESTIGTQTALLPKKKHTHSFDLLQDKSNQPPRYLSDQTHAIKCLLIIL